tara:strand:- start:284 stop:1594 length:1311 start_codon:yes stop_codon:yes gene_type:complete
MSKKGQLLWEKAKTIIPGGNQLLSKRAELFLPGLWPAYYKKAKGCKVYDLDNKPYYDFAGMGVTACILGYANDEIDSAVKTAIDSGSLSTLNSYEEVQLAEKLVQMHPWADMVRFSKTGGEACAIAVRIARASSGKNQIAFCGYHGWHDWYLSANLSDSSNLTDQLLPGLDTRGVPRELIGTAHPFYYNDFNSFKKVIDEHGDNIGAIMMEPQRGEPPKDNFLSKIREIATSKNIVLIFDEVTSGFHNNFGGIHLTLDINPDIAIFAKALGNGYPISAIVGKREVMDAAQDTFISSTMWTERLGFAAGLASLKKMEDCSVQDKLVKYGQRIKDGWKDVASESGLRIKIGGLDSIPSFSFNYDNSIELLTYFNQEMLAKGFLTTGFTATTYAYSSQIIDNYINCVGNIFNKISQLDIKVEPYLKSSVKHTTFARLTD